MSIVINGKKIETPGLQTISWLDDPKVPQATDFNTRAMWIRAIVLHTVHGKSGRLLPGFSKPSSRAKSYARYQANTARKVSWDYTVGTDGTIIASNDPVKTYTWHAGDVNPYTVGIEFVQEDNGDLYEGQMDVVVRFLDVLTRELADAGHPIQRQVPMTSNGEPVKGVIARIENNDSAKQVVGIYGHRNQTGQKPVGDPGDDIFHALLRAGYKGFNLDAKDDITFWKDVQARLGLSPADGIPGRATQQALLNAGNPHGLWVERSGDR